MIFWSAAILSIYSILPFNLSFAQFYVVLSFIAFLTVSVLHRLCMMVVWKIRRQIAK